MTNAVDIVPSIESARALAARVRRDREAAGWSTRELAAAAGVSEDTVTRLEAGRVARIPYVAVARMLFALSDAACGRQPGPPIASEVAFSRVAETFLRLTPDQRGRFLAIVTAIASAFGGTSA